MSSLIADLARVKLHLTQILVGYEDAVRLLKIRDTYDWHQRVWEAFRGRDGEARDFLVRVDRKEEVYRLLILSRSVPRKPDWCPTDCFGTKTIPDDYFQHRHYRFSLLANPTKKLRVNNPDGTRKKNGRRAPIVKRQELIAWLQRKAEAGGFAVDPDSLQTLSRGREYFDKPGARGTLHVIEFNGELAVRATVAAGVGSAKAFGFGLLALSPLS